jgi:hypothetical protein
VSNFLPRALKRHTIKDVVDVYDAMRDRYLGRLVNIELPVGGDATTLNVNHYWTGDAAGAFAAVFGPTYRGLYDLAAPDRSRFVAATGQSGNPLSRHYANLTALWAAGEDVPMSTRRADFTAGAIGASQTRSGCSVSRWDMWPHAS